MIAAFGYDTLRNISRLLIEKIGYLAGSIMEGVLLIANVAYTFTSDIGNHSLILDELSPISPPTAT